MRALKSPAIKHRASASDVWRKLSLPPPPPTSAATPTATESTTIPNLPGADFRSRQPMAPARFQLNSRLAILCALHKFSVSQKTQRILHHHSVLQHDLAVRHARDLRVVRHKHQRCSRFLVSIQQKIQYHTSVWRV